MPTYSFECGCGVQRDVVRPMSLAKKGCKCPGCGKLMLRVYGVPQVRPDSFRNVVVNGSVPGPNGADPWQPWELGGRGDYKKMVEATRRAGLDVRE